MIRINLLPFRAARQKENIRRQVSVFVLLIILMILALVYYTDHINMKIIGLKSDIKGVNSQISLYKEKADRVTKIKKQLKILDKKLELVESLKNQRRKPIELLDAMTRLIVSKRMWLTELRTNASGVILKGMAFDNKTVADFMTRIEGSPLFGTVDLKKLERKKMGDGIQMKAFEVFCHKPTPATDKKGDTGKK